MKFALSKICSFSQSQFQKHGSSQKCTVLKLFQYVRKHLICSLPLEVDQSILHNHRPEKTIYYMF